jgi:hypothetical protein
MSDAELELSAEPQLARDDVPWTRKGYPHSAGAKRSKWTGFVNNTGLAPHRFISDDKLIDIGARGGGRVPLGYLEERSLAECWDYENNGKSSGRGGSILHMLLRLSGSKPYLLDDREIEVAETAAATLISWLGTNVGRGFLQQAFEHAKKEQARLQPKVDEHVKFLTSVGEVSVNWIPIPKTPRLKRKTVKGKK